VWHAILIRSGIAIHVCKAIMVVVMCDILLKRLKEGVEQRSNVILHKLGLLWATKHLGFVHKWTPLVEYEKVLNLKRP
jgi:hypothetical protein